MARHRAALTQRQLAARAGVGVGTVRDIEQGRTLRPDRDVLRRLAAGLDVDLDGAPVTAPPLPRLGVLGPLELRRGDIPVGLGPIRQRVVLGLLAVRVGEAVSRAALVDAMWGEAGAAPASAANAVQVHVSRLRRALCRVAADPLLTAVPGGYRLVPDEVDLDLLAFRHDVRTATYAAPTSPGRACELFARALARWRGPLLADVEPLRGHPAVLAVERERAVAVLAYADAAARSDRNAEVVPLLRELTAADPLDGAAHARLMIALAGSGRQAAAFQIFAGLRRRLADELGVDPDHEVIAAHRRILRQGDPGDLPIPRQLPAPIAHFAGRAAEFATLDGLLTDGDRPRVAFLSGSGGVGKTTLAVRWAHHVADRFPDGCLYINLRGFDPRGSAVDPREALRDFLCSLGVPPQRVPSGLDALAAAFRSRLAGRRLLVILDNARSAHQVRPLLAGTPGCLTVVTSRDQMAGLVAAEGALPVTLGLLGPGESRDLLVARLGARRVNAEPEAADAIVGQCAGLPLALSVVATRAALHPQFTLGAVAGRLGDASRRLDGLAGDDPTTDPRTVFSWSYQSLSPRAARLFRHLGVATGPDISSAAAAALVGLPPPDVEPLLAELARAHLVTEAVPGRFTLHDLLRAYAAELAQAAGRTAALHRLLDHYLHTAHRAAIRLYPHRRPVLLDEPVPGAGAEEIGDHDRAMAWFTAEAGPLLAAVGQAHDEGFDTHCRLLAGALVEVLDRQGRWHDLATSQRTALAAATRTGDLAGQAQARYDLGFACTRLAEYDEAIVHLRHALDLCGALDDPAGQGRAHLELARTLARQDRHRAALGHAEEALVLFLGAGDDAGKARALNAVGWYHTLSGDHERALGFCREAIAMHRVLGNPRGEAGTWASLGYAYRHLGRHAEAVDCYLRSVELCRTLGDRYNEGETLLYLGDAQRTSGDARAARESWQQALLILTDLKHPDAAEARSRLTADGVTGEP
ncbi:SARP family transcriptional regulator [Virgisporangium aurantiacum]|uniref:SARP family transcriptional regulator n=1 Tax=Virgisporangium aurantiacum TaxID=175570 RepID=A0A8J3ZH61_9ACTN|nr:SARP family transcriptional regulator [Virgisporangium aurantiacum]